MADDRLQELLENCSLNDPAAGDLVAALQTELGKTLPEEYVDILKISNGLEGSVGDKYLSLWRAEDLLENNAEYKTEQHAAGMLVVGSDGGNQALGLDLREDSDTYGHFFWVTFVPMLWNEAVDGGTTLEEAIHILKSTSRSL